MQTPKEADVESLHESDLDESPQVTEEVHYNAKGQVTKRIRKFRMPSVTFSHCKVSFKFYKDDGRFIEQFSQDSDDDSGS